MKWYFLKSGVLVYCVISMACGKAANSGSKDDHPQVTPSTDTSVVFCNGFEDGNLSVWDDWDNNSAPYNLVLEDPGPFNKTGNHVMRLRVPPGRGGADLVKVLPKTYNKLYARWYVYWEPGYDFTASNHGSGLFAGTREYLGQSDRRPTGTNFAQTLFEPHSVARKPFLYTYYRGMYQDCVNPDGACWGDQFPCYADLGQTFCTIGDHRPPANKMPPVLTTGKWYRVEIMMDLGKPVSLNSNADGVLNMWIDGIEYGPWKKMWFRSTPELKLSILWLQLFHHNQHSEQGILIDDVVVSPQPIGTTHTVCQ